MDLPPETVYIVGTIVLGLVIAYALWRSRQATRLEKARAERKTHDIYTHATETEPDGKTDE